MAVRRYPRDDFEAQIRIYPPEEGGRKVPAFNRVRWDFCYADDPEQALYMIWPDFCQPDGDSYPADQPLPTGVELPARMVILNQKLRAEVHQARLIPGVRFYCCEGRRHTAEGVVTRITGLHDPRRTDPNRASGKAEA